MKKFLLSANDVNDMNVMTHFLMSNQIMFEHKPMDVANVNENEELVFDVCFSVFVHVRPKQLELIVDLLTNSKLRIEMFGPCKDRDIGNRNCVIHVEPSMN